MGDIVTQDRAYSIEVVLAMIEMFEEQFQEQGYSIPVRDMEAIMFFIASCFGGFRGYETVWTDLAALRYDVAYSEDLPDPDVAWPVTAVGSRMNTGYGDTIIYPLLELLAQVYVYLNGHNDSSEDL